MKIIEKSGYQALPWVRYITQSGGTVIGCKRTLYKNTCEAVKLFLL